MIKFFILWIAITLIGVVLATVTKNERKQVTNWTRRVAVIAIPTAVILSFIAFLEGAL
jgi:hypothetical protein